MKAFIIHLSKIEDSYKSAISLKDQLIKICNMEAELFEGTYGNEAIGLLSVENRKVHDISFKGKALDERGINKALRPGVVGCFYSHYRLWQKCEELNETIAIFEDDVDIVRPLIEVDFEDVLVTVLGARKNKKYLTYLKDPIDEPRAVEYLHSSMPGTPGYLISPSGAKKLLERYKYTFLPSDNAINLSVVKIQIHNHLIGIANLEKKSLTRSSKFWNVFND